MLPAEPCVVAPIFILGGTTMAPLQEQIQAINQRLRAYGIEAWQGKGWRSGRGRQGGSSRAAQSD